MGGVGLIDAGGRLTVWNGTTWAGNTVLPEGHLTDFAKALFISSGFSLQTAMPYAPGFINDFNAIPNAFSPPVVEDFSGHRLLAFRDSATGLRELSLLAPGQSNWVPTAIGKTDPPQALGGGIIVLGPVPVSAFQVNPHPFELLSPEHLVLQARSDLATRTDWQGVPKTDHFPSGGDEFVNNLYWPFRLLSDPTTQRVRILTHRGAFWEVGSESSSPPGGSCVSADDCANEHFCARGVCCSVSCIGTCQICDSNGTCQRRATGSACSDGKSACSNGILTAAGQCSGDADQCGGGNITQACAGGLACADANSCKTHCASAADCADPTTTCTTDGLGCRPARSHALLLSAARVTPRCVRTGLPGGGLLPG